MSVGAFSMSVDRVEIASAIVIRDKVPLVLVEHRAENLIDRVRSTSPSFSSASVYQAVRLCSTVAVGSSLIWIMNERSRL